VDSELLFFGGGGGRQNSKSGLGSFIVEVPRSHTIRRTYLVRLLWTSDQPAAKAANYIIPQTQETNIHALSEIQTRVPSIQNTAHLEIVAQSTSGKMRKNGRCENCDKKEFSRKPWKGKITFLFLSFRRVLNVNYSFLGNSPASEF